MARQPICDANQELYAYELLFRSGEDSSCAAGARENEALALGNALIEIGLDRLVGEYPAFVNISAQMLNFDLLSLLPKKLTVIELLEDVEPTPEALAVVRELFEKGYTIALDDYTFQSNQAAFLPFAKIVKVDVLLANPMKHVSQITRMKQQKLTLLAEKVEDQAMFETCKKLGFHLFQGYFFAKPVTMTSKSVTPSQTALLRLLGELQNPNASLDQLEHLIGTDPSLTYRLLKLSNSAAMGAAKSLDSIRQALLIIGVKKAATLVTLLAMYSMNTKPKELILSAMIRGRLCEGIAEKLRLPNPERYFTAGLLSVLDAILDMPIATAVTELNLAPELFEALTNPDATNELAKTLRCAIAYERGKWDEAFHAGIDLRVVAECHFQALAWAMEFEHSLGGKSVAA